MVSVDLETASLAQLAGMTSVHITKAYLARIAAFPHLNAVRAVNPDVLAEADAADRRQRTGPLHGIPVLLKDNIDVDGMPTTVGSVAMRDCHPGRDAALVANLRAAGAVILGKANLTEWANIIAFDMPSGYSSLGGQVLNPYDASRSPSGSSSGSSVAAAAGLAPLTVGTETSGSILSPAAACSVVGVKPTVGLISRTGVVPIAASQDTAGPMTRTVADAAALLTAMAGTDPRDAATEGNPLAEHDFTLDLRTDALAGARIGVAAGQGTDDLWDAALAELRAQGATLVPVRLDTTSGGTRDSTVLHYELKRDLNAYLEGLPAGAPMRSIAEVIAYNEANALLALKFGQGRFLAGQAMDLSPGSADTARYEADRAQDLADSRDRIDAVLAEHDLTALLFPGSAGSDIGARAGYPSVTVPAGYRSEGRRPVNITLLGAAWSEPALIGYAYAYEQASRLWRPPSVLNPTLFRPREVLRFA